MPKLAQSAGPSPKRHHLPAPAEDYRETLRQRLQRKARTKTIRLFDKAILRLYHLIAWLDDKAPPEKRYFRVALFGSSRTGRDDPEYAAARELARQLSYLGCDIVTGGGPGLMTAANEGARLGAYRHRTRSFGLDILLPMEEQPNPFLDERSEHRTFFSRLHQFIRLSHAYIVLDGGLGTTLEALMVWQLLQVRHLEGRTLIFLGPIWKGLRTFVEDDLIARGMASPGDTSLVHWVDSPEEAAELVRQARDRFLERHEVQLPPPAVREGPPQGEGDGAEEADEEMGDR